MKKIKFILVRFCHWLFELIHHKHYNQEWNGKKRLKTIKILSLKSALVDDMGQRKTVVFYFKIGKYFHSQNFLSSENNHVLLFSRKINK